MAHEAIHAATHAPGGEDDISATYQQKSQKGAANGYAGLGADGKVPSAQLPAAQAGGVPTGVIVMWHGTLASIPEGWVLCDGQNGTPDLRSKFVKGAADATNPGDTGGALTHGHAAHDYTPEGTVSQPTVTINALAGGTRKGGTSNPGSIIENGNVPTGTVSQPTFTGQAASLTHDSVNHEPPFYTVAFIMKT